MLSKRERAEYIKEVGQRRDDNERAFLALYDTLTQDDKNYATTMLLDLLFHRIEPDDFKSALQFVKDCLETRKTTVN